MAGHFEAHKITAPHHVFELREARPSLARGALEAFAAPRADVKKTQKLLQ